ncbi:hypothetical protein [Paraburkholderia sp. Cy-641]|uniref:hypothetical protein n=1 Tax=Paraburkholderia sp. Cy-641 TaxID=2608337 RepID=UPI001421B03A|nr:hypothetical protein [Paraburkholderia sp. Cy-641]
MQDEKFLLQRGFQAFGPWLYRPVGIRVAISVEVFADWLAVGNLGYFLYDVL